MLNSVTWNKALIDNLQTILKHVLNIYLYIDLLNENGSIMPN